MSINWKKTAWAGILVPLVLLAWLVHLYHTSKGQIRDGYFPGAEPLEIVIADPLSSELAPARTGRDYSALAAHLGRKLGRAIQMRHTEALSDVLRAGPIQAGLIIGQASVVQSEATLAGEEVRPMVRLTDKDGRMDLIGLFIVRDTDAARTVGDLGSHRILFGPPSAEESHGAALTALAQAGVTAVPPLRTSPNCRVAAQAVIEGDADAAVVPAYAQSAINDCNDTAKTSLRVIGRTAPVPFVTVFATSKLPRDIEPQIADALLSARNDPQVLQALGSRNGFVLLGACPAGKESSPAQPPAKECTVRAEPNESLASPRVPTHLPSQVRYLWRRGLSGPGLSGLAAARRHVIVADKSPPRDQDIWRCLDAETGEELWSIAYATPTEMEFTNAPRATPVIHGDIVYLLGAFGDLHCVSLRDRRILWRRNLIKDFGAELPTWGTCSTPLVVDDKVIVNPGAKDASLAALNLETGEVLWKTPGESPAYASLILGTFGGVRQIVGYDATSLGGWDPNTGQRLWTLMPPEKGDFHVTTPVEVDGQILLSTARNGTRLHRFDPAGRIDPVPVAWNADLCPDTATPTVVNDLVFGCSGGLLCLDLRDNLRALCKMRDDAAFKSHAAFIAGNGRVLGLSVEGELVLLKASRDDLTPVSRLPLLQDGEVWSRPALIGDRLYVRSMTEVCCILLSSAGPD
jgi:outer membrane protein assembly factor BamB